MTCLRIYNLASDFKIENTEEDKIGETAIKHIESTKLRAQNLKKKNIKKLRRQKREFDETIKNDRNITPENRIYSQVSLRIFSLFGIVYTVWTIPADLLFLTTLRFT